MPLGYFSFSVHADLKPQVLHGLEKAWAVPLLHGDQGKTEFVFTHVEGCHGGLAGDRAGFTEEGVDQGQEFQLEGRCFLVFAFQGEMGHFSGFFG